MTTARSAQSPAVLVSATASHVPGPATGTVMTSEYVQAIGPTAYVWGWPLVNMRNRSVAFSKLPGPGLIGGVVPAGCNTPTMIGDYISPDERAVACPKQDVAYGRPAGNGWNSPVNSAQWGTDYLNRAANGASNIFENVPEETKYFYRDFDGQGQPLEGKNRYAITFRPGELPRLKGFWSLTLTPASTVPG